MSDSVEYIQTINRSTVGPIRNTVEHIVIHDDDDESEDDGFNNYTMANTIIHYVLFSLTPFIVYLTYAYIHPKVSSHLKRQYLQVTDNSLMYINHDHGEQETNLKFAKNWNIFCLRCLFAANVFMLSYMMIYFYITLPPDSPSATEAAYNKTIERYIMILSYFVTIPIAFVALRLLVSRWRRLNIITILSIVISLNMVYIVLYFFPATLVTFTCGPLQAKHTSYMTITYIISSYPISWFSAASLVFSNLVLKKARAILFSFIGLTYLLVFIVLRLAFFCLLVIIIMIPSRIMLCESYGYNGYRQNLDMMLSLIALVTICMFKPFHHYAYKYATANVKLMTSTVFVHAENPWVGLLNLDDKDKSVNASNTCVKQTVMIRHNHDTKSKEIESTIV